MTLVRVGASSIDRQGLFAATDIPRGTRIVEYRGEKISKGESARRLAQYNVYIVYLNEQYDIDGGRWPIPPAISTIPVIPTVRWNTLRRRSGLSRSSIFRLAKS